MSEAFLSNYLIGLREGLEGALVVTVLVAFLVKSDRRDRLSQVWAGVAAAVAISVGFSAVLVFVSDGLLDEQGEKIFAGVSSIIAVGFVTGMIFWMRRISRHIARDLRTKLDNAVGTGVLAVAGVAFLAVIREGLETALLFFAVAQNSTTSASPLLGLLAGIATSVGLGWLMYAGAIRINLSVFFVYTGVLLVLVAAGILRYGVHELIEAGVVPGQHNLLFDFSAVYDRGSWYGALLAGMFNVTPKATMLEAASYLAYLVPVLAFFLWPRRAVVRPAPAAAR